MNESLMSLRFVESVAKREQREFREESIPEIQETPCCSVVCHPLQFAELLGGETVLVLGSGAGFDAFLAASLVGDSGKVVGVEMSPDLIHWARTNALSVGVDNVEFRLGESENLPVADQSADIVVSDCVINLSSQRERVFREIYRVLKPGGQMITSDLVLRHELSTDLKSKIEAYVKGISAASVLDQFLAEIKQAGFHGLSVLSESPHDPNLHKITKELAAEMISALMFVQIRCVKPV